jgi:predicted ABC-type ATPase
LSKRPRLIVFAGPNGSGKSTVIEGLRRIDKTFPSLYINADDIANECHMEPYEAAMEAEKRRNKAIEKRESFAMETVLSAPAKIDFLNRAKASGYEIVLKYIITEDPLINVTRVEARVKTGGHDVPRDKTLARYKRSRKLLPQALRIADVATIYDNSFTHPVIIGEKSREHGIILYPQKLPSMWDEQRIKKLVGAEKVTDSSESHKKES